MLVPTLALPLLSDMLLIRDDNEAVPGKRNDDCCKFDRKILHFNFNSIFYCHDKNTSVFSIDNHNTLIGTHTLAHNEHMCLVLI